MDNLKNHIFVFFAICLIGFLSYSNSFEAAFQFDDEGFIINNNYLHDVTSLKGLKQIYSHHRPSRFVGFVSLAIDYHFYHENVFGYHITNFIVHILNGFFVWWFVMQVLSLKKFQESPLNKAKNLIAFFAALIFVSHPLQTQAVTYIYQRAASLASFFYLVSVNFYLKGRRNQKNNGSFVWFFVVAGISAVLGMLTKETLFTLPFIIILFETGFLDDSDKDKKGLSKKVMTLFLIITPLILFIPATFGFDLSKVFTPLVLRANEHEIVTSGKYFLSQCRVIPQYIRLLFIPLGQNLDYDLPLAHSLWDAGVLPGMIFILSLIGAAFFLMKRNKFMALGLFWFFITLSVEASFIPIRYLIFEHRLYLPMAGFSCVIAAGLFYILRDYKKYVTAMIIIVVILSTLTYLRNEVWRTKVGFWEDVVSKSPNKCYVHFALGGAYYEQGAKKKALVHYNKALNLYNHEQKIIDKELLAKIYNNVALIFMDSYQDDEAFAALKKSIDYYPEYGPSWNNLGILNLTLGNHEETVRCLKKSIACQGEYADAWYFMGKALLGMQEDGKARESLLKARKLYLKSGNQKYLKEIDQIFQEL